MGRSGRLPTDTETEEEYQKIRRKSVVLRESCDHDIVKECNMNDRLKEAAVDEATMAIVRASHMGKLGPGWDNEISARIKKRMEKTHKSLSNGHWHCVVGPDFGSCITYEKGLYIYMYLPRYLSPVEDVEYKKEQRRKAKEQTQTEEGTKPEDSSGKPGTRATHIFESAQGPPQRMVGILLWRT